MNNNFQTFVDRMNSNIGYKSVILPLLPKGSVNILDVGGGTGILSHQMKLSNPQAHITLLDRDIRMLEIAESNKTADLYVSNEESLPYEIYDAVVFCSILHEVPYWEWFLRDMFKYIKPGGKIIIRDGFKTNNTLIMSSQGRLIKSCFRPDNSYAIQLKNPEEAIDFFKDCGEESVIGGLNLYFEGEMVRGTVDDVRSFLQTYTWGYESMHREKNENHLFASAKELAMFLDRYSIMNMHTFKYTGICQQNYFKHLSKIAVIEEMWNTHFVMEVTTKKD